MTPRPDEIKLGYLAEMDAMVGLLRGIDAGRLDGAAGTIVSTRLPKDLTGGHGAHRGEGT